jgi:hypothetical protein
MIVTKYLQKVGTLKKFKKFLCLHLASSIRDIYPKAPFFALIPVIETVLMFCNTLHG